MVDLPIVDAHVHLWELAQFPRPWLGSVPALDQPFDLAEYDKHTSGFTIAGLVYVETDVAPYYALLEAQWAVSLAEMDSRLQGIVAAAPPEDGVQVKPYLNSLAAPGPVVKGVQRNLQEKDPEFCLRRDFIAGVELLETHGFSFDLCIRHEQLPAVTVLARACPSVRFVLDHLGKPAIRERQLDCWREGLAALAEQPNVACKLGGIVTEADWRDWRPDDLESYVAHALAVFGPNRVKFGSDWPVVTLASTYRRWAEALESLTHALSFDDQRQLWCGNACHWYRL